MNLSRAISHLKMMYRIQDITLPYKRSGSDGAASAENIIHEVLSTVTIPTYSQFKPWERRVSEHLKNLKVIDEEEAIYLLPPLLTVTPVMYVASVDLPQCNTRGTFGDIAPAYGIDRSTQGVITSQMYMMVAGQMRSEPSFDYLGDNKIKLYGYPRVMLSFRAACEHEPNGETIPDSCYDSFIELASLDIKMFLYNTLKLYDNLPTAFGNLQLKIDDYQSAESDRNALLDRWRDTFHLDMDFESWM